MALNFGVDIGIKSVGIDKEELEGFEWFTVSDGKDCNCSGLGNFTSGEQILIGLSSVKGGYSGSAETGLDCLMTNFPWILISPVLILASMSLSAWKVVPPKQSDCRFFITRARMRSRMYPKDTVKSTSPKEAILVFISASRAS